MALSGSTFWEVQTGGDDTNFSGAFDPGQSAGMFTDGAATSATTAAPVFTSASYNFVAGDVGAWVFIATAGTSFIPGWYHIDSVASNAATLNGTAGQGVLWNGTTFQVSATSATGCATADSPTGATWSIDYSQQAASRFTYTDLSSTGVGMTASSAGFPFGKQYVGNSIVVTGGTNFTVGRYVLASVAAGVGTFIGAANLHTGAGTDSNGAGRMGGALATPGLASSFASATAAYVFVKSGTYTLTNSTGATSGGPVSLASGGGMSVWVGYETYRADLGSRPTINAGAVTAITLVATSGSNRVTWINIDLDGNGKASLTGFAPNGSGGQSVAWRMKVSNCTVTGILAPSTVARCSLYNCSATGCSGTSAITAGAYNAGLEAYGNTTVGIIVQGATVVVDSIAAGNSGASSDGFQFSNSGSAINCSAYGNGRDGFRSGAVETVCVNCIAEGNTGFGFGNGSASTSQALNCATFNNSGGSQQNWNGFIQNVGSTILALASSPFTNAAAGDFSLNNTASAGASCRAAGFPGTFLRGATVGYLDIGAAQHADPASSGGGSAVAIFGG